MVWQEKKTQVSLEVKKEVSFSPNVVTVPKARFYPIRQGPL